LRVGPPGAVLVLVCALIPIEAYGATQVPESGITTPQVRFGFNIGDDYRLVNYTELEDYWKTLASESDRMTLVNIGTTAEGRPIHMAIITSPENHANIERYKEISRRLALAEGVSEAEARELAAEGRSVVWIDGGLHANEVLGAQQLIELVFEMVSREDDETLRFLDSTILLAVCVNPDGLELVADWYMRESNPQERSVSDLPRLYQKYAGHDNNRDFYMSSQPETEAINRVLFNEWFPQIVYNHHQTGPEGTVLFAPPFRDPFNYNYDPLILTSLDLVASAMHSRLLAEGKAGATRRSGGTYSTWWNGGLRTSPYFHNMIGILTEMIGSPTPIEIPFVVEQQLPRGDYPFPIEPQTWRFRQSVEYSMTANRAVLDVASRYRDTLLFNIWRMGMNSIERGSRDNWTTTPDRVDLVDETIRADRQSSPEGRTRPGVTYLGLLRDPDLRDPRGYILSSAQPDFATATKFVNALIKNGVAVDRATSEFQVGGRSYPEGSYIVKTAQAFRPHILDMFEPQIHPDDFPYPGASPTPPYDMVGWTLAYQMGVVFDRILEGFDGPFERIEGFASVPAGQVSYLSNATGFFLSHRANNAFVAVNRLLAEGDSVHWLRESVMANGKIYPEGTMYFRAAADDPERIESLALELGLNFDAVRAEPSAVAYELSPVRIGLWDRYGGSEPSGWTRFILESFEFPFERVYPPRLDQGELASEYDVLIFPDGAIPPDDSDGSAEQPSNLPEEYAVQFGRVSVERTVPRLLEFLEDGGTLISIGGSTVLERHIDAPVSNLLVERLPDGTEQQLPAEKFFIPGSLLRMQIQDSHPLAFGLPNEVDAVFNNSPTFRVENGAMERGFTPVAWFGEDPLRSGWAWGEDYIEGGAGVVDASVSNGKLLLFGPEIAFRGQSHGTFKLLFNGIYYPRAREVTLGNRNDLVEGSGQSQN
jgi:hypothetical protein